MTEGLFKLLFYDRGSFQAAFLWPRALLSSVSMAAGLSTTPGLSKLLFHGRKPFYDRGSFQAAFLLLQAFL
jgi:hypothetical protein